ncbi:MAG: PIN domain-containing protein [Actinomycetota bacterium]
MRILLDSTVLIDYLRDRPVAANRVDALADSLDQPCTTAINIEEIVRGLRSDEMDRAQLLFEGLEILPLGNEEAWRAGTWRRGFAGQGVTLPQADCLVAAAAFMSASKLATGNPRHFPMTEIEVEHWPVGE